MRVVRTECRVPAGVAAALPCPILSDLQVPDIPVIIILYVLGNFGVPI